MSLSPERLKLYLIRHGETEWSLSSRHTSRTELPLTNQGEKEAKQVGKRLQDVRFTQVFTSPRLRAQRTCALADLSTVAEIEPDLAEWDYGDYEGRRSVEIHQERPDWNIFRDGCPHGEAALEASHRTDRLISKLRTLHGNIALFSHGQLACVLAARWIGLPVLQAQHFVIDPATLSILGYEPNHHEVSALLLWNASSAPASRHSNSTREARAGIGHAMVPLSLANSTQA